MADTADLVVLGAWFGMYYDVTHIRMFKDGRIKTGFCRRFDNGSSFTTYIFTYY